MTRIEKILRKCSRKQMICAILGICIAMILTTKIVGRRMAYVEAKYQDTQQALAGEVFRFHVIANSDSSEDQKVKLKVRDAVISYMKESMDPKDTDMEQTRQWVTEHLDEIEDIARQVVHAQGDTYEVSAEVTKCYFPDKYYGDILFPEGWYDALRIRLGKASGHNWWCVLYPNLCFMNTTCAVVDEDGKKKLKDALSAQEYEMVTASSEFKIKWFFFGEGQEEEP